MRNLKTACRMTAILTTVLLLSACPQKELIFYEVPENLTRGGASKHSAHDVESLMIFYGDVQKQNRSQRNKTLKRLNKIWQKEQQPGAALQLVLLLIEGNEQEKNQAEEILNNLLNAKNLQKEENLANFVLLLRKQLTEQRRNMRLLQARNQQLNEQQIQIKSLAEKINALKSIEKSIYEREYGNFAAQ